MVDTVALTPTMGIMADPFAEDHTTPAKEGKREVGADRPVEAERESLVSGVVQAGPLAVGGVLANGLNVVATVLIARLLTTRQYGSVAQLLGLFFVLSMPGSALLVGVVRRVAAEATRRREADAHRWTVMIYRRAFFGVVAWSVLAAAIQLPIARALRVPANGSVALVLISGGVWLLLCIDRAVLQVHRRYAGLGLNLLTEIAVRTAFVLVFAAAGLGILGYAIGLLVGEVAAAAQAHIQAARAWKYEATGAREEALATQSMSFDLVTALVGFGLIGILQNTDIILIGRLAPENSGAYAAISVASKSLVFGAILLGSYVLPEAAIRWHRGEHAVRQLVVTLLFLLVPTVLLLALAVGAPHQFLTIVFSGRLAGAAQAFAPLVGAMACLGVTVIVTNYLFGAARRWVVLILGAGVVVLLVLIDRAHGGVVATARAELEVQAGLMVAVIVAFLAAHRHFRRPAARLAQETGG